MKKEDQSTIDKDSEEAVKEWLETLVSGGDDLVEHYYHQVSMGACQKAVVIYPIQDGDACLILDTYIHN